jgi:NAD-dependent SIR2 family protein deacetylase
MKSSFRRNENGYQESIRKGLSAVKHLSGEISFGTGTAEEKLRRLKKKIQTADAILIGAGAGLSTSAGLTYNGERFEKYFFDFAETFGIGDMYSGGFYPFPDDETRWAWWARHIYFNRYIDPPKPVYKKLLSLTRNKDFFVITTNVDHQFQRAGFDKSSLFYTQGDYGLFQSVNPVLRKTYDNQVWVMKAMEAQGFHKDDSGIFQVPDDRAIRLRIPADLIPKCPDDGSDMTMNLRSDETFVEDEGWHRASAAYADFLYRHEDDYVLYLELGVGANTPVIIKYPFWQMVLDNANSIYTCLNYGEAFCPKEIESRSLCINEDIGTVFDKIIGNKF